MKSRMIYNMKKLLIIGAIALVVVGCLIAAGCTSTTNTTEDFAVGTWTMDDGTTIVITNDFKGVQTVDGKITNFTWKKTTDGKYEFIKEDGAKTIATLDKNKGILTNTAGTILTKKISGTSGTIDSKHNPENDSGKLPNPPYPSIIGGPLT